MVLIYYAKLMHTTQCILLSKPRHAVGPCLKLLTIEVLSFFLWRLLYISFLRQTIQISPYEFLYLQIANKTCYNLRFNVSHSIRMVHTLLITPHHTLYLQNTPNNVNIINSTHTHTLSSYPNITHTHPRN